MPTSTASSPALTLLLAERERRRSARVGRVECEASLHAFVQHAWPLVEPAVEFRDNWHVRAVCEHLAELAKPEPLFTDLIVNIPPGCMKSLLASVFWPCWVWSKWPESRWMFASYSAHLSTRDSQRRRDIIQSSWYQDRWPMKFVADQNEKTKFRNEKQGWMFATSVGGAGTGEHPDFINIDDPHSAEEAESTADRQAAIRWYDNTVSTRGIIRTVRRAVEMQRLHRDDLSGHLLGQGVGVNLCFPMEFEHARMPTTPLGFQDPRTEVGELLWPDVFTRARVDRIKQSMAPSRQAGQLQQRPPEQDQGSEWPASYFGDWMWFDDWPLEKEIQFKVIYLDPSLGETEKSDYSPFVVLALDRDGVMWVDVDMERRDSTAMTHRAVSLGVEHRPQAFGVEAVSFQKLLINQFSEACKKVGYNLPVWPMVDTSKKTERIRRLSPFLARKEFRIRRNPSGVMLMEQLRSFPGHRYDDGPDALEGAVRLCQQLWQPASATESVEVVGV